MQNMPFQLADESQLDENSLKALNEVTSNFSAMFKAMDAGSNQRLIIPEYDEVLKAVATVIDGDYLVYHRIRERHESSPLVVYSYVTFFGDAEALLKQGLDPMDAAPSMVSLADDVIHFVVPMYVLPPDIFAELIRLGSASPMTTTTTPFYISDPKNKESALSQLETSILIEIN